MKMSAIIWRHGGGAFAAAFFPPEDIIVYLAQTGHRPINAAICYYLYMKENTELSAAEPIIPEIVEPGFTPEPQTGHEGVFRVREKRNPVKSVIGGIAGLLVSAVVGVFFLGALAVFVVLALVVFLVSAVLSVFTGRKPKIMAVRTFKFGSGNPFGKN
jgi:hypothetical protein